jgi:hypothetical protein
MFSGDEEHPVDSCWRGSDRVTRIWMRELDGDSLTPEVAMPD